MFINVQDIKQLDGIQLILYPAIAMAQGKGAIKNMKGGGEMPKKRGGA